MSEKTTFLENLKREVQCTIKVLKHFPPEKADLKPAEKSMSAKELAFIFVGELTMQEAAIMGALDFSKFPKVSGTIPEIIARYERESAAMARRIEAMPDADWNAPMDFMVGPGKMDKVRRGDILWLTLHDMIHHRGQFSVYLRIAGAKVPSIYGPSADEPWM